MAALLRGPRGLSLLVRAYHRRRQSPVPASPCQSFRERPCSLKTQKESHAVGTCASEKAACPSGGGHSTSCSERARTLSLGFVDMVVVSRGRCFPSSFSPTVCLEFFVLMELKRIFSVSFRGAGSRLLPWLSLVALSRGSSSLRCLRLVQSTRSRHTGFRNSGARA